MYGMAKRRRRTLRLKWKHLGFLPEGWDESRTIKYRDEGFLYLCRLLRNDWREFVKLGLTVRDLKWRPGRGGCNCSYDWTGLDDAILRHGRELEPPPLSVRVTARKPGPEEREELGRTAHRNWRAVRQQQRAAGQPVDDADLRPWDELSEGERELFRRGGETLAVPDEMMWAAMAEIRKRMGEKAFRRKMFEVSVSVAIEKLNPDWSEAERYRATHVILNLSEMLEVPPGGQASAREHG
jgi:hypothetical protein